MVLKNNIVILGSTGVLGTKLVNFLHKNKLKISIISCFSNYKKLYNQKTKTKTKLAIVLDTNILKFNKDLNYGDESLLSFIKTTSTATKHCTLPSRIFNTRYYSRSFQLDLLLASIANLSFSSNSVGATPYYNW